MTRDLIEKVEKKDDDMKIFNLEMVGLSPNACTILLIIVNDLYVLE